MHPVNLFSKQHEEMSHNSVPSFSPVPWWSGLGSQPVDYEQHFAHHFKTSSKENPPATGNHLAALNQPDRPSPTKQQGVHAKEKPPHFTISPSDWGTSADVQKFHFQNAYSLPMSVAEQEKHFELGFRQPMMCARFPYGEQYYGVVSTYASHLTGRIMLPLNSATDEGTIFVNAKQYNGILRRRQYRAKIEQEKKAQRNRKPFLHLSRHLHAMRRPRGCGGRFLNTKDQNGNKGKNDNKNAGGQLVWASGSHVSEILLSDSGNSSSPRGSNGSRSNNSGGSEVTSMYFMEDHNHHFVRNNRLRPNVQNVPNTMNAGHGIALHNNKWVVAAADACCNLEV